MFTTALWKEREKEKEKNSLIFDSGNKPSITFNKWYTYCFYKQILIQINLVRYIQML